MRLSASTTSACLLLISLAKEVCQRVLREMAASSTQAVSTPTLVEASRELIASAQTGNAFNCRWRWHGVMMATTRAESSSTII
jgi:hypothetical protein